MNSKDIRSIILREYGNARNPMTPHDPRYGLIAQARNGSALVYERASGTPAPGSGTLYGISIVAYRAHRDRTHRQLHLSRPFWSSTDATRYVDRLRRRCQRLLQRLESRQ